MSRWALADDSSVANDPVTRFLLGFELLVSKVIQATVSN
jgi:hypothetical protein